MDISKLTRLTQARIEKPCPEDWDTMTGDERVRHCAGCGCHVVNLSELSATDAEALLGTGERVCARLMVDEQQRVLTRDGWVPRMLLAGAVAATVAGCASPVPTLDDSTVPLANAVDAVGRQVDEGFDQAVDAVLPSQRPVMGWFSDRPLESMSSYWLKDSPI